ncbi:DUF3299 domain-containing protein [Colwellia sp. 20A7]|uniref:DUF3299 domain-containing protein n=1 Tax=Colwellia sp. 20A7 TaxID=2689569 RepID=UPI001F3016B2|nr:DUF3299 domain-containing protein [Colwellia sp. 20A7]
MKIILPLLHKKSSSITTPLTDTPLTETKKQIALEKEKAVENVTLPTYDFMTADWLDLIPEDDLDALLNPPDYLDEIVDGSEADKLNDTFKNEIEKSSNDRYQQALVSTRIKPVVNNAPIKIPAFIVPLGFDDEQKVTQFFMVPYYGACIHLPPPPPNQTIFVNYPKGLELESLYDAYWVSGIIKTSLVENETAIAAYSMDVHAIEFYTEE